MLAPFGQRAAGGSRLDHEIKHATVFASSLDAKKTAFGL
jgi:hypothetical protein